MTLLTIPVFQANIQRQQYDMSRCRLLRSLLLGCRVGKEKKVLDGSEEANRILLVDGMQCQGQTGFNSVFRNPFLYRAALLYFIFRGEYIQLFAARLWK
jgi:hypothetical protein